MTYRYLAHPTPEQATQLRRNADGYRTMWNLVIEDRTSANAPVELCGVRPTRQGEPCSVPRGHFTPHDARPRCTAAATLPTSGPCRYYRGHAGPCRPLISNRRCRFMPSKAPSHWLKDLKGTFRFWSTDTDGIARRWGYESVPNVVLRGAETKVHTNYRSYVGAKKNGDKKAQPPSFKSKRTAPLSFDGQAGCVTETQAVSKWIQYDGGRWATVRLPQPGDKSMKVDPWIRIRYHRPIPADSQVRWFAWSYDPVEDRWYVSLMCRRYPNFDTTGSGAPTSNPTVVGIDRGITVQAACFGIDTSTGEIVIDRLVKGVKQGTAQSRRVLKLQRSLDRKHHIESPSCWVDGRHKKGPCQWRRSNRALKAQSQMARLSAQLVRQRRDAVEVLTHDIIDGSVDRGHPAADVVAFESLSITSMGASARGTVEAPGRNVKAKSSMNRGISDSTWGRLATRTRDKATRALLDGRNVDVIEVPAAYTSQRCAECGHTCRENRRADKFACVNCGHIDHADRNAARNIVTRAISARGGNYGIQ